MIRRQADMVHLFFFFFFFCSLGRHARAGGSHRCKGDARVAFEVLPDAVLTSKAPEYAEYDSTHRNKAGSHIRNWSGGLSHAYFDDFPACTAVQSYEELNFKSWTRAVFPDCDESVSGLTYANLLEYLGGRHVLILGDSISKQQWKWLTAYISLLKHEDGSYAFDSTQAPVGSLCPERVGKGSTFWCGYQDPPSAELGRQGSIFNGQTLMRIFTPTDLAHESKSFTLSHVLSGNFNQDPNTVAVDMERVIASGVLTSKDLILANYGLHCKGDSAKWMRMASELVATFHKLKQSPQPNQPHLMWRETSPQHNFPTRLGWYYTSGIRDQSMAYFKSREAVGPKKHLCAPMHKPEYVPNAPNAAINRAIEAAGVPVMKMWDAFKTRSEAKSGYSLNGAAVDCTHWCEPYSPEGILMNEIFMNTWMEYVDAL